MTLRRSPFTESITVTESDGRATLAIGDRQLGVTHRNAYGLWPVRLPIGMRYYSNPLACAYDLIVAKHITREEADRVVGPSAPRHRVRVRNGREYHEYY